MAYTVTASTQVIIHAPLAETFARFIDFPRWHLWMTDLWTPVSGPAQPLASGDCYTVVIRSGPLPMRTPVKVFRVEENRECTWGGGLPGIMHAEHCFFFEAMADNKTRIRSEEVFSGVLIALPGFGSKVQREIQQIGAGQVGSFARWMNDGCADARRL